MSWLRAPHLLAVVSVALAAACRAPGAMGTNPKPLADDTATGDGGPDSGDDGGSGDAGDAGDSGERPDTGETPTEDVRVVIAPDYLNLRAGPSSSDAVQRALPCGAVVTVTGDAADGWLPVQADADAGWVYGSYLAAPDAAGADPCPGPDPYLDDTPGRVEEVLSVVPYVEQSCQDTTWSGWPFDARRCTYNGGLQVVVADPSAQMVTAWIADASQMIPALWSLKERDRGAWKRGLEVIARHTLYQSSRIFPLEGEVDEGYVYDFDRGVTVGCSTGCYCRINSVTRNQWCAYADEVLGIEDEGACLSRYSTTTWTDAWAEHCLDNHRAAWTGVNHHYRAMAHWANESVAATFSDPETADPDAVVALLEQLY